MIMVPPSQDALPKKIYRSRRKHVVRTAFFLLVMMFAGLLLIKVVMDNLGLAAKPVALGVTFSKSYAEYFGLDWRAAYTALLDDLGVRRMRLPVYWDDIERERGVFNFENIDWQMDEAAKRGAKVILAAGRKLPRWPECHVPAWARELDESGQQARVITMLTAVVRRFREHPAVVAWQVENEPFFEFGVCPKPDKDFLLREIAVVRALDKRPIIITESGELSTWIKGAAVADILGISTYRIVWQRYLGYFFWPLTPRYYTERARAVSSLVSRFIISELQAEPWITEPVASIPIGDQLRLMDAGQLRQNVEFVRRIGFPEAYLWGAEWWFWLKQKGYPELWETARELIPASYPKADVR